MSSCQGMLEIGSWTISRVCETRDPRPELGAGQVASGQVASGQVASGQFYKDQSMSIEEGEQTKRKKEQHV
ncbi:hypothetical protein EYF80_053305 [Liparis tanakae]|uniref:Uncharacterized protein n=1 Tax=Liparis tanakae TaxID=230148 RepID=A0A4Z2F609_9TELE|nr:hypothetical protein EYF80_053305 [Liparis tanakae]